MDSGVAGYDNTFGLPPFFPTWLRFEVYIYRLWIQQDGVCSAHVDAAQNHTKSNYMRNPPAEEILAKITALHRRALRAAESEKNTNRMQSLRLFAANLEKAFYGFEPDFFQQNLLRIVDDVIGVIKGFDRVVAIVGGNLLFS